MNIDNILKLEHLVQVDEQTTMNNLCSYINPYQSVKKFNGVYHFTLSEAFIGLNNMISPHKYIASKNGKIYIKNYVIVSDIKDILIFDIKKILRKRFLSVVQAVQ